MKNSNLIFLAISTLAVQGCAHNTLEKKVDIEVAQETKIKTRGDLRAELGQLIQSTPGLTDDQRSKLLALRDSNRTQDNELRAQSLKLRSVLIKEVITTNYNDNEVELIKKRIKTLEDKRLSLTFNAIEQADKILGHESKANRQSIMNELFEGRGGRS